MNKQKRLFFAVNLPNERKKEIGKKFLSEITNEKWGKVKQENLHITMAFLGHHPLEFVRELERKGMALKEFDCFEISLNGVGHFKNRILWIGIGAGGEELNTLNKRLEDAIGMRNEKFHPHITLARNKGSKAEETDQLISSLRKKPFKKKIEVKSVDLMESVLHLSGPEYKKLFSINLRALQ